MLFLAESQYIGDATLLENSNAKLTTFKLLLPKTNWLPMPKNAKQ